MKKLQLPGSKSITNRVLILAALGDGPVDLYNVLDSDDARYMQAALEQFGVQFEPLEENAVRVVPPSTLTVKTGEALFIGNAGTAARFLSALSLITTESFTLTGIDRMKERPQQDLHAALEELGVQVEALEAEGFLPTKFTAGTTIGDSVALSGRVSSQFLTALLLVAPRLPQGLTISIDGDVPSWPYVEMTLELLTLWGVEYQLEGQKLITIKPGFAPPKRYDIPSDMSGASYPIAWSVLSKTPIEITNFGQKTLQGDEGFLQVAEKAGASIKRLGDRCQIWPGEALQPIGDMDWSTMPDVSMTGMILAACAPGTSVFTGLESLRVKECDRIAAMEQLRQLGVSVEISGDTVRITGREERATIDREVEINSFEDHRIAMCFGVLRAVWDLDFAITEPECVAKTWPQFWLELADWKGQLRAVSAIILHRVGARCGLDKYLIVKKPRKENAWQFPQGGVDPGETALQAAKRELAEECGANLVVKFKGERPVLSYKYLFPADFKRYQTSTTGDKQKVLGAKVSFFKAEHLEGVVEVDGEEIVDHQWVTLDLMPRHFSESYWSAFSRVHIGWW